MKKKELIESLEAIRRSNSKRKLLPQEVIDAARSEDHPLHSYFEWDDSKAAEDWRKWQARQLIASIEISADNRFESEPVYVSLVNDRKVGGYRAVSDVLSSSELRREMVETALGELKAFQFRYERLSELAGVFREAKKLERRFKNGKKKVA